MKNVIENKSNTKGRNYWLYEYIVQYIESPIFRDPIKEYIDENCINFESEETENSFEQTEIHKVKMNLIRTLKSLLRTSLKQCWLTSELHMSSSWKPRNTDWNLQKRSTSSR